MKPTTVDNCATQTVPLSQLLERIIEIEYGGKIETTEVRITIKATIL